MTTGKTESTKVSKPTASSKKIVAKKATSKSPKSSEHQLLEYLQPDSSGPLLIESNITVYSSKEYDKFSYLPGNRPVNKLHLTRLEDSLSNQVLDTVIIVNNKFQIIDGQHRFENFRKLNLPINFIISDNYGLKEVQILNSTMKKWENNDFLTGYCDLGMTDYIIFRNFKKDFGLPIIISLFLLSGEKESGSTANNITTKFENGNFKVLQLEVAIDFAEKINKIKLLYKGATRRSFVYTIYELLHMPKFSFDIFLRKLALNPTALQDCVSIAQYKDLIETIYNKNNKNKINLRF